MKTVQKTACVKLRVDVECEACGKKYGYDYVVKEQGWAGFDIEGRVMDRVKSGDFGLKRCPFCGYVQSWMQKKWNDKWRGIFSCLTAFPLTVLLAWFVRWPEGVPVMGGWLPLLFYVIVLFLCGLPGHYFAVHFMHPNRGHRSSGYPSKTPLIAAAGR